ncbi:MAG: FecR domain-containing protein [Nodosilinea sp.]
MASTQGIFYGGVVLAILASSTALAQETLTRAQVYTVQNQVDLNRQNQGNWQPAAVGAELVPQDALRTGGQSRAELLFNEGTLVRTGENTTFRFPPGRRNFEITNGSSLFMIRPGLGASQINTPQAVIVARGTALFVQHDERLNESVIGVLTESPAGPVTVSNLRDDTTVQLGPGQFVSVANGVIGLVDQFLLPVFYSSVDLAVGLAPGQEAFVSQQSDAVQATINAVRAESIPPLTNQVAWLGNLCQVGVSGLQEVVQQTSLLQWLWPGTIPPEVITLEVPESDLVVMPLRSFSGLAWLSQSCQTQPTAAPRSP